MRGRTAAKKAPGTGAAAPATPRAKAAPKERVYKNWMADSMFARSQGVPPVKALGRQLYGDLLVLHHKRYAGLLESRLRYWLDAAEKKAAAANESAVAAASLPAPPEPRSARGRQTVLQPATIKRIKSHLTFNFVRAINDSGESAKISGDRPYSTTKLTVNWINSLVRSMAFVLRRPTKAAQHLPENYDELCLHFPLRIAFDVFLHILPPDDVFNAGEFAQTIVPNTGGAMTRAKRGSKNVPLGRPGLGDKRVVTEPMAVAAAGRVHDFQIICRAWRTWSASPSGRC